MRGQLYLNGRFVAASQQKVFDVINPYTLEKIGEQALAQEEDREMCLEGVIQAFPEWKLKTAYERAGYLRKLHDLMLEHEGVLAQTMTLEQGKPLTEALGEVRYAASYVAWYAEEGIRIKGDILQTHHQAMRLKVLKEAIGPVGIISPWNFPLAMFVRKLAPALAAGCTVMVKPAEQTPLTAFKFFELIHQAGFPPGVCQLITGDAALIGASWMKEPRVRKLSFTGSTEVGKLLLSQSGQTLKKLSLELGGHAPFMVFEDANLDKAVEGAVSSKFRNCGQVCIATNRVLVQRSVYEPFKTKLIEAIKQLKVGNGLDPVDMGPIIDHDGFEKIKAHVKDALDLGATCLVGGQAYRSQGQSGGYLFEPTLLGQVREDMLIAQEETFGPVLPLMVFDTEEEGILMANNTPFGLAAYCYTESLNRATRLQEALDYGMIGINTGRISSAQAPFGGVKMSGFGREGGSYGIEEYLVTKYIALDVSE